MESPLLEEKAESAAAARAPALEPEHSRVSVARPSLYPHSTIKKGSLSILLSTVRNNVTLVTTSVLLVVTLSVLSQLLAQYIEEKKDEDDIAAMWVDYKNESVRPVQMIGSLLIFAVVFRFNACYKRWWDGRNFWGDLMSKCLEMTLMTNSWVADEDLRDRMDRFTIVFVYACKALLHNRSLADDDEEGGLLVERGLLTREELDDMHENPCWQPHYCLHMIRSILVEVHMVPGGKALRFDHSNKLHGQMFSCFDGNLKGMNDAIGKCIRLSATGLPASYDTIVWLCYFSFFILASVVWGMTSGWMAPIIIFVASLIIMLLIVMGTQLVDPFGYDRVDIPLEAFCHTVEAQIYAINQRSKRGKMQRLAQSSTPEWAGWKSDYRDWIKDSANHISESLESRV